jgi:PAS domain S-box-containing protein
MYRIFGIGREGFSGYLSEVVANAIHPDDRAAVNASNLSVMKKNKPIPLEYRIVRPDGSIRTLWAEAGEMTIDSNGQALMLTGYVQDITERKIAEKALSDNEAKYRSIVETAAEGIILTTPDGVITYANQQMADLVGCSIVDLIGKVGVSFMKDAKPTTSLRSTLNKGGTLSQEFEITHQDGQKRRVWSIATPIINESQEHAAYLHMFTDITEQKMAEEKIKASLEEKEVLLKEIQHRVKNNMQVMVSLLQMQAARVKDPADAQLFKDSQERVRSMALVYEKLHQSEDLARVNLKKYVTDLVDNLVRSYSVGSGTHRTIIEVSEIKLGLDTAIPCGLIINEVISNSLKYAFPDGRTGTISVVINETDGRLEMAIADDGIGLPEEISRGWMSSLGMQLIHSLTEYQLGGKVEIERSGGTKYRIVFPLK